MRVTINTLADGTVVLKNLARGAQIGTTLRNEVCVSMDDAALLFYLQEGPDSVPERVLQKTKELHDGDIITIQRMPGKQAMPSGVVNLADGTITITVEGMSRTVDLSPGTKSRIAQVAKELDVGGRRLEVNTLLKNGDKRFLVACYWVESENQYRVSLINMGGVAQACVGEDDPGYVTVGELRKLLGSYVVKSVTGY